MNTLRIIFVASLGYLMALGFLLGYIIPTENFPVLLARCLQVTAAIAALLLVIWPVSYVLIGAQKRVFSWKDNFAIIAVAQIALGVSSVIYLIYDWFWPTCKFGVDYAAKEGPAICSPTNLRNAVFLPVAVPLCSLIVLFGIWFFQRILKLWSKK